MNTVVWVKVKFKATHRLKKTFLAITYLIKIHKINAILYAR